MLGSRWRNAPTPRSRSPPASPPGSASRDRPSATIGGDSERRCRHRQPRRRRRRRHSRDARRRGGDHAQPVPANAAVLDELSAAFAERPIISIGDDELPDAVYLDDELERGVAVGATLFIDDDGSADAVAPKEASTRGIEPRLRQRRIGVRGRRAARRLKWVIVVGAVLAVVVAALAVLGSSLFAVKNVDVTGNVYTDADATPGRGRRPDGHAGAARRHAGGRGAARVDPVGRGRPGDDASSRTRRRSRSVSGRRSSPCSAPTDRPGCSIGTVACSTSSRATGGARLDHRAGHARHPLGGTAPIGYSAAASFVTKLTPTIRSGSIR